jgi:hypothetical protein
MSMPIEARAQRLLRWYPARWRDRYGEEFAELLTAEIEEQPSSWRRTIDVAKAGLSARLSLAGLDDGPVREPSLALASTGALVVTFAALAISVWTQLATAAHSMPLDSTAAATGIVVLTATLCILGALAMVAAAPVVLAMTRSVRHRERRGLLVPTAVIAASTGVLFAGGRHFAAHWTALAGTGHSATAIPDRATSFAWAETYSISTFWAHPNLLLSMNLTRLGWMVASPLAVVSTVVAAAVILRRVALSSRVLHFEARLASLAVAAMLPMLAAASWWVVASQHDSYAGLRAGSLDLFLITAMGGIAVVARSTTRRLAAA